MFWDQTVSREPQDMRSHERRVERFITMTGADVIDVRQRYVRDDPDYVMDFHVLGQAHPEKVQMRTKGTHILEIDNDMMEEIVNAVEQLNDAEKSARLAHHKLNEIDEDNRDFHEFMAQNPELREQYRELMTMCKLAGLRKIPSKLT